MGIREAIPEPKWARAGEAGRAHQAPTPGAGRPERRGPAGGQRQRLCIARALAVEPDFLICDESVSALDVSVQAQVLNLLKDLQEKRGLTYIFISHDLSVVKFMSDMMAVMNAGKIVEFGPSDDIYANPQNEYTQRLIAAIPQPSLEAIERRERQLKERLATAK